MLTHFSLFSGIGGLDLAANAWRAKLKTTQAHPGARAGLTLLQAIAWDMWPTLTASEWKGVSKNRYAGSGTYRSDKLASRFRTLSEDLTHINPDYAEAFMDFPTGWTVLRD